MIVGQTFFSLAMAWFGRGSGRTRNQQTNQLPNPPVYKQIIWAANLVRSTGAAIFQMIKIIKGGQREVPSAREAIVFATVLVSSFAFCYRHRCQSSWLHGSLHQRHRIAVLYSQWNHFMGFQRGFQAVFITRSWVSFGVYIWKLCGKFSALPVHCLECDDFRRLDLFYRLVRRSGLVWSARSSPFSLRGFL
jgi:hypothetical protein